MSLTSPAAGQASASSIPSASSAATSAGDAFAPRHLGPAGDDLQAMLNAVNASSLDELSSATVPADIQLPQPLNLPAPLTEHQALAKLKAIASQNQVLRSMIGMGYHNTHTPPVIQRNIFENPLWYTPYTPYQAEIAQGRLEALLNFQTMLGDLTGLPVASASLLDEATAAAEAMAMCHGIARGKKPAFYIADNCHPQTIAICQTRAWSMGIDLRVGPADQADFSAGDLSGILLQYPATCGSIEDYSAIAQQAHDAGALVVAAADILALTLLTPPGEWGADIAVGSTQRFGVPMGFGGPHAAYMTTTEKYVRKMPGRLVGVSKDEQGNPAYRLAIQTREQHIKRDKATSNICTAQVLLAILAGMYAVWHGPAGLKRIATEVHGRARSLAAGLKAAGVTVVGEAFFDTVAAQVADADAIVAAARKQGVNIRKLTDTVVTIACDETTSEADIASVLAAFDATASETQWAFEIQSSSFARQSDYLTHPVFHRYRSETEMMRYITRLQRKDISLAQSMIPLGSCTMKLNAAAEMYPVTWPEFGQLHPYAPADQTQGYAQMFEQLENWLAEITGFAGVSLQPNAGSQGEYAGLLAIRRYHESRGQGQRDVCLIPTSAHGTNPASAIIAGLRVVPVQCDDNGNINVDDLRAKAQEYKDQLSALMVTYPSTHGVFETAIREICKIVHDHGGQVYMDGANMNAQVGLCSPGNIGADVCHLNLHKTFCIPHGGGGPGMGPIGVAAHLVPFLPGCPLGDTKESRPVSAAAFGSPSILPIPWMYIAMMGEPGLKRATQIAILSANYMARKLADHYDVLYTGPGGRVAHEFIIDCRGFEKSADIKVEDIAKRLMDFGFHAPTMSFPVPGTLMIEPTESESREELDRFCDALIAIREEIRQIEAGTLDREDNPLKHAPHTAQAVTADDWAHAYKREQAAYPLAWVRENKFWPPVGRIDNAYGDRHLVCTCPPMSDFCES